MQAILVFDYGIDPREFTKALERLRLAPPEGLEGIACTELDHPSLPRATHVYSFGKAKDSQLDHLYAVYDKRQAVMPSSFLRSAGEWYVRSLFKALPNDYREVTRKKRLGKTGTGNLKGADLFVTEIATNHRFAISVKNIGSWMPPGDRAIKDVYARARAAKVKPWLFVSFALPETRKRCQNDGIRLTVLDHQMVHAKDHRGYLLRWVLKNELFDVHGPQPFGTVYSKFSATRKSPAVQRDLVSIADLSKTDH